MTYTEAPSLLPVDYRTQEGHRRRGHKMELWGRKEQTWDGPLGQQWVYIGEYHCECGQIFMTGGWLWS